MIDDRVHQAIGQRPMRLRVAVEGADAGGRGVRPNELLRPGRSPHPHLHPDEVSRGLYRAVTTDDQAQFGLEVRIAEIDQAAALERDGPRRAG
jgi:hypothetical protein